MVSTYCENSNCGVEWTFNGIYPNQTVPGGAGTLQQGQLVFVYIDKRNITMLVLLGCVNVDPTCRETSVIARPKLILQIWQA